jgi:hypothetical protein
VIGLGQAVQRQHAEHGRQRGGENGTLEGHRDERRPAGTSVRISKMEIIGRTRMNRKSSVRNRPMVPT